jgi:hypothetical protein
LSIAINLKYFIFRGPSQIFSMVGWGGVGRGGGDSKYILEYGTMEEG